MAEILIRDLDPNIVLRLKAHTKLHGRSLQKEIKLILRRIRPDEYSASSCINGSMASKTCRPLLYR